MLFVIAEFTSTREVEVIPKCWVLQDGNKCLWPPYKTADRINRAVQKAESPSADWTAYHVRILYSTDDYQKARTKLNQSEFTSDLATDSQSDADCPAYRKRKRVNRRWSSSSESEEETIGSRATPLSKTRPAVSLPPPPAVPPLMSPPRDTDTDTTSTVAELPNTPNTPRASTSSRSAFEKQNLLNQQMIKQILNHHTALLNQLLARQQGTVQMPQGLDVDEFAELPLTTITQIDNMEERLAESSFKKSLIAHVGTSGGATVKETVWRILSRLFSHSVSIKINWSGSNGKRAFRSLQLHVVVLNAVRQNALTSTACDENIEAYIKRWFQLALDRNGGRKEREARRRSTTTEQ